MNISNRVKNAIIGSMLSKDGLTSKVVKHWRISKEGNIDDLTRLKFSIEYTYRTDGNRMKESVLTERSPLMMVRYKQPSGVIQETHW